MSATVVCEEEESQCLQDKAPVILPAALPYPAQGLVGRTHSTNMCD